MSQDLKLGDRVRVTSQCHTKGYQAGDKGTVLEGPTSQAGSGAMSYVVAMDKDGPSRTSIVFTTDEIESDM